MRKFIRCLVSLISVVCFYCASGQALAVANGQVIMAKGMVTATGENDSSRTLAKGADVFKGDVISTASKSFAVIRMMDQTKLTLKPGSSIAIGEFNLEEGNEEGCVNLIQGGLRTVTGLIGERKPEAFQVDTPVASIGIRGTDFSVRICAGDECLREEQSFLDDDYRSVEQPTLPQSVNQQLPQGLYSSCETGVIVVSKCAGQAEDFELGKCRINQQKDCTEVELRAGQAGYVSYDAKDFEDEIGIVPLVPHFMNLDPYFRLSNLSDRELELIELFKDEFSQETQCEFTN